MNSQSPITTMGAETSGLVASAQGLLDKIKGPVFWFAIGFVACKLIDRKKKRIVSV